MHTGGGGAHLQRQPQRPQRVRSHDVAAARERPQNAHGRAQLLRAEPRVRGERPRRAAIARLRRVAIVTERRTPAGPDAAALATATRRRPCPRRRYVAHDQPRALRRGGVARLLRRAHVALQLVPRSPWQHRVPARRPRGSASSRTRPPRRARANTESNQIKSNAAPRARDPALGRPQHAAPQLDRASRRTRRAHPRRARQVPPPARAPPESSA